MKDQYTRHTFSLAKLLLNLRNAELYAVTLAKEPEVQAHSRHCLNRIGARITATINDFRSLVPAATVKVIDAELLPEEYTLQVEAINDMLLALPKSQRDTVERYTEGLYNTYRLNK